MRGGIGTVIGALVGAMIMASLDNGMSMLGIDTFWQQITKGIILVARRLARHRHVRRPALTVRRVAPSSAPAAHCGRGFSLH